MEPDTLPGQTPVGPGPLPRAPVVNKQLQLLRRMGSLDTLGSIGAQPTAAPAASGGPVSIGLPASSIGADPGTAAPDQTQPSVAQGMQDLARTGIDAGGAAVNPAIKEAPDWALHGILSAVNAASSGVQTLGAGIGEGVRKAGNAVSAGLGDKLVGEDFIRWYNARNTDREAATLNPVDPDALNALEPTSFLGKMASGFTQFGVGMLATPEAELPALADGVIGAIAPKAISTAQTLLRGVLAEQVSISPYQQRFSNWLEQLHAPLVQPVAQALAASPGDPEWKARLKMTAEGSLLGLGTEALIGTVGLLRSFARVRAEGMVSAQAEKEFSESLSQVQKANATATAQQTSKIAQTPDGQFTVLPKDAPADAAPTPATTFNTPQEAVSFASSLDEIAHNRTMPQGALTDEQVAAFQAQAKKLATAGPEEAQQILDDGIGSTFNLNTDQSPQQVKLLTNEVSKMIETQLAQAGRTYTHYETSVAARSTLDQLSPAGAGQYVQQSAAQARKATADALANRAIRVGLGKEIARWSEVLDTSPSNGAAADQLRGLLTMLRDHMADFKDVSSSAGRTLEIHKVPLGGADAVTTSARNIFRAEGDKLPTDAAPQMPFDAPEAPASSAGPFEGMTRDDIAGMGRLIRKADGDPDVIMKVFSGTEDAVRANDMTTFQKAIRLRTEALLSGPSTFGKNFIGNAWNAVTRPLEYWWAGNISRNPALQQQGWDQMMGLGLSFRDSARAAWRSFRENANLLTNPTEAAVATQQTLDGAASEATAGALQDASPFIKAVSWFAPSRYIMATDEFFKQLSYRSMIYAKSLRMSAEDLARNPAMGNAAEVTAQRLQQDMSAAFTSTGAGLDKDAVQYAKVNTLQNSMLGPNQNSPLGPYAGSIGKTVLDAVNQHPGLRIVMPFVKTPANLFYYSWERTPVLNGFNRQMLEDFAAGGERAALAQAKTDMGLAMYSGAAWMAYTGMVTGGGPSNPDQRKLWLQAGHQQYSIKNPLTGGWIPYRSLDPVMYTLGMVADMVQMSGELGQKDNQNYAYAALASITSQLSSKSYLLGLTQALSTAADGNPWEWSKLARSYAGSNVPNLFRQADTDPFIRESHSILEEMQSRTQWGSKLEPATNIFGEPILRTPGFLSAAADALTAQPGKGLDPVIEQLRQLGPGIAKPERTNDGLDWGDRSAFANGTKGKTPELSPYGRLMDLASSGFTFQGRTLPPLRVFMQSMFDKPQWKDADQNPSVSGNSIRLSIAQSAIQGYYQAAKAVVESEYPKLHQAIVLSRFNKYGVLPLKSQQLLSEAHLDSSSVSAAIDSIRSFGQQ